MTDPYHHPTPSEWRNAYRIDRDRKAHERGLRALARIKAELARKIQETGKLQNERV